ncbi:MAG: ABC transporter substrate binding protein [Pseudolabrys sp.]
MRRRKFIAGLAGAAAFPLAAFAQQSAGTRRIGVLTALAATDPAAKRQVAAFVHQLEELGWAEGRNLQIDYRWANDENRYWRFARELLALTPEVVLAVSGSSATAPSTVSVVFMATSDPVNRRLIVTPSAYSAIFRERIIALAARLKLPAIYYSPFFATDGGLCSCSPDMIDQYRRAAGYIDRILKGEKPADMPVQAPAKFEFVINLRAARLIDLNVTAGVVSMADHVIK